MQKIVGKALQKSTILTSRINIKCAKPLQNISNQVRYITSTDIDKDINKTNIIDVEPDIENKNIIEEEVDEVKNIEKCINNETIDTSTKKEYTFEAETRQLLDIVINSQYTDKDVFIRELLSNASDALEKVSFLRSTSDNTIYEPDLPLEIRIFVDKEAKTITIQDTGIGMTKDELISNVGTIARSGSKQFVKEISQSSSSSSSSSISNIIGQFGVGFYSSFMVGNTVELFTRSAKVIDSNSEQAQQGYWWKSDGSGNYELAPAENVERGTKVIIHQRDTCMNFIETSTLENIVKRYSNFIEYPISINGKRINTIQAIWTMNKNEITEEQHKQFYRHLSGFFDDPQYTLHINADAPIQINALFYFPEQHMEKFGMGRMDSGTSLYSRRILIKNKMEGQLPDYQRFVQGVVDSEDVPLNISRESMQDTTLISKLSSMLTKRIIKFQYDESRKDEKKYNEWYKEFSIFLKEGICSDYNNKQEQAKQQRYETSKLERNEQSTLDEYVSRMPPEQKNIYYLCAPNYTTAINSPYYEGQQNKNVEVLFLYHALDDFVMQNLREYNGRNILSAESGNTEVSETKDDKDIKGIDKEKKHDELIQYLQEILKDKVSSVIVSKRQHSHPAVIIDHESSTMRKMMRMMDTSGFTGDLPLSKQKLEVNMDHIILQKQQKMKDENPGLSKMIVEQMYDNALLAADILDNPRSMQQRMTSIMENALNLPFINESTVGSKDSSISEKNAM